MSHDFLRLWAIKQASPGRRGGGLLYDISLPKTYRPKLLTPERKNALFRLKSHNLKLNFLEKEKKNCSIPGNYIFPGSSWLGTF